MPGSSHSMGRPDMQRSHTFPTPPTSATGVMGSVGSQDGFSWGGQSMNSVHGSNGLAIDTGLSNARSMPSTPATTPPGAGIHGVQQQYQSSQAYDPSRYSAPPLQQGAYQQAGGVPQINNRYSQPNSYIKSEMGPPIGRGVATGGEADHLESKSNGLVHHGQATEQAGHHQNEEEAEHENDGDYNHENNTYDANRTFGYAPGPPVAAIGEQSQLSGEIHGSPIHQAGPGRATRTVLNNQAYYTNQTGGYDTPPRGLPPSSNLYNVISSERGTANGNTGHDVYQSQTDMSAQLSNGYSGQQPVANGVRPASKRGRDDDDDENVRPSTGQPGEEIEGMKRRRTIHEDSAPTINYDSSMNRQRAATLQRGGRR